MITKPLNAAKGWRKIGWLASGLALGVALCMDALAANEPAAGRPKIGLVLSGGGARGAAHVGVLKVLEELRIPIDYIAGTSMGAIIGALYASGMPPVQIEKSLQEVNWDGVFSDPTERRARSFQRKLDDQSFLIPHKPGVKDGEIKLPMALVEGQKFDLVLQDLLRPVASIRDFNQLRIPFRAVATDLATGKEVVLKDGYVAQAARASMAVPGAFAAVEIDGKTLVDGGMANNLPISVVREMGADIVIAVDISTPLLKREEISSVIGVMEQLTGFLTWRNTEEQIASLTDNDTLITPSLNDAGIGSGDFKRAAEAIAIGERAAREKAPRLAVLSIPQDAYARYLFAHPNPRVDVVQATRIDFIEIDNHSRVSDDVIRAHFQVEPGAPLDTAKIEQGIARIYGLDHFQTISYTLEDRGDRHGLRLHVREKEWGTNSLQLGLELFSGFGQKSAFNLGGAVTYTPLGENAGEWRTLMSLGEDEKLVTEVYYPLDPAHRWFVGGDLGYESQIFKLFDRGEAVADYETNQFVARLRFGRNLEQWGRIQMELERATGTAEVNTGRPELVDYDFEHGRVRLTGTLDTLDNFDLPRQGDYGLGFWQASRGFLGASKDYDQFGFSYAGVSSWGDHSLLLGGMLNATLNEDAPVEGLFRIGGFLRLSGLQMNALSGQHTALLRGMYRYRLNDKLVPLYAGGSLEVGGAWNQFDEISLDSSLWGGSLFLAADTPLGPGYLGYGYTEGGNNSFYLMLGNPWY